MQSIVQDGDSVLRQTATPVSPAEFGTDELTALIDAMHNALVKEPDGVAIAAPQIGASKRIFVVSPQAFKPYTKQPLEYINPVIKFTSKEVVWLEEGCLSVRWKYGKIQRHIRVVITAQNRDGTSFTKTGTGLLAQIFQHEIDHLDGILFHDNAIDIKELNDDERNEYIRELKNPSQ